MLQLYRWVSAQGLGLYFTFTQLQRWQPREAFLAAQNCWIRAQFHTVVDGVPLRNNFSSPHLKGTCNVLYRTLDKQKKSIYFCPSFLSPQSQARLGWDGPSEQVSAKNSFPLTSPVGLPLLPQAEFPGWHWNGGIKSRRTWKVKEFSNQTFSVFCFWGCFLSILNTTNINISDINNLP